MLSSKRVLPPPTSRILDQVRTCANGVEPEEWWKTYFPDYDKLSTFQIGRVRAKLVVAYIMAEGYYNAMPNPTVARLFEAYRYTESPAFSATRYGRTLRAREMNSADRTLLFVALLGWELLMVSGVIPLKWFRGGKRFTTEDKLRLCVLVYMEAVRTISFDEYAKLFDKFGHFSRAACALGGGMAASLSWRAYFDTAARMMLVMPCYSFYAHTKRN